LEIVVLIGVVIITLFILVGAVVLGTKQNAKFQRKIEANKNKEN
jgi:hypothetical protein